jgi:hypothetical protein
MPQVRLSLKSNIGSFLMAAALMVAASTNVIGQRRPLDCSVKVFAPVDVCSGDSSFIVTIECGPLSAVDSLLLYDISVRFPASKVSFKQVLYQNTLSENLETKGYGSRDTGVIRVYGFNITRFLSGSKPLVALLFKHAAGCADSIEIGFSSLPEFNPEAKVYVRETRSALVPFSRTDDKKRSLTFQFSNDTIVLREGTSSFTTGLSWMLNGGARANSFSFKIRSAGEVRIDSISHEQRHLVDDSVDGGSRLLQIRGRSGRSISSDSITLHCSTSEMVSTNLGILEVSDFYVDTCSCTSSYAPDSLKVNRQVASGVENHVEGFHMTSNGDVWEIENRTDADATAELVSMTGTVVWRGGIDANGFAILSSPLLVSGVYLVKVVSPKGLFVKKLKVWK